jgi:hypothetical protein
MESMLKEWSTALKTTLHDVTWTMGCRLDDEMDLKRRYEGQWQPRTLSPSAVLRLGWYCQTVPLTAKEVPKTP